jgi:hypothetical protein
VVGGDYHDGLLVLTTATSVQQYLFSIENGVQVYEPFSSLPLLEENKVTVIPLNITDEELVYAVCILSDSAMNIIHYTV